MKRYRQPLKKQITSNLELTNFDWHIEGYYDNVIDKIVTVDVIMVTEGARKGRGIIVPSPAVVNVKNLNAVLLKMDAFKGSKEL